MKNKDRKYAVKLYLRRIEEDPNYTESEFGSEIIQHLNERPLSPQTVYDPFGMYSSISNLWNALNMSPSEIVEYSMKEMENRGVHYMFFMTTDEPGRRDSPSLV